MSQHSNDVSSDHGTHHRADDSSAWWIARAENATKIWHALVTVCVFLILIDFGYHTFSHEKHGYFDFETAIGFHAAYGFGAFVFVVLLGKELRKLIMRDEDYYTPPVEDIHHEDIHHEAEHHHEGDHHA